MKDYRLKVEPFAFVNLREVKISKQADEHSFVSIAGVIAAEKEDEYLQYSIQNKHTPISIAAIDENGGDMLLFYGVAVSIQMHKAGNVITMEITGKSSSYLLDITPHFRTYQDVSMKCSDVLKVTGENYDGFQYIIKSPDIPLGAFTVQYYQTDWQFMKRMANRSGSFLVPADTFSGIRFYMGMPVLNTHALAEDIDFSVQKDHERFDDLQKRGLSDISQSDIVSYLVQSREIYEIGDEVIFHGMKLFVFRIDSSYDGQEMVHVYTLKTAGGFRTAELLNEDVIGASLDAQVINVNQDEVQVKVTGDEYSNKVYSWFSYATVYSSPNGAGWYCMPELGDLVRLYIPDKNERQAFVFNAMHEQSELRTDPDIKFLRNKYGKEIRFTPDSLVMTNNSGMEISIVDGSGVFIESDQAVSVKADGNIDISSSAGISMMAGDSISVQQGGTSLVLDDNISFTGGKLQMQ